MAKFINILDNLEIASYDGKKISLCTSEGKPVRIQIPRMYMPFGISGFVPEVGQTKWNIDFSMLGYDEENNYVNKFYNTLHEIENKIIESVSEQSEHIFGKEMSVDQLRPMFNSNIKTSPERTNAMDPVMVAHKIYESYCNKEQKLILDGRPK